MKSESVAGLRRNSQPNSAEASTEPAQPAETRTSRTSDRVEEFLKAEQLDGEARKAALQELSREYGHEINEQEGKDITRDRGGGQSL